MLSCKSSLAGALALTAIVLSGATAGAQTVAILGAPNTPSWNVDVQSKVSGTGLFATVDIFNVANSVPSLATLKMYNSVLVYTDGVFTQTGPLGDVLDEYVRGGGGVVDAVFASASIPVGGKFQTQNDYSILPLGQSGGAHLTLAPVLPGSPLLEGVNSFDGGSSSYFGTGALNPTSTLVAKWSNGASLVAYHQVGLGTEVTLNFFPPSSDVRSDFWLSRTDGARLLGNALRFAGPQAPPAVPEPGSSALLLSSAVPAALFAIRRARRRH